MFLRGTVFLLLSAVALCQAAAAESPPGPAFGGAAKQERSPGVKADLSARGVNWCTTQARFDKRYAGRDKDASCFEGACDVTATRNASIPGLATPMRAVRIQFHVFREDDGSNPAATELDVARQVEQLNSDFAPSRIQFIAEMRFVNDSDYRVFFDTDEVAMKNTYALSPASRLNIYVVEVTGGYLGVGTFPWDSVSLGNQGGIIMNESAFGPEKKTLTHEVGHCLGLWHTHHGVTEMTPCEVCYERANGANADTTGDLCSDTDPTPVNFDCEPPGGTDSCSSVSWGATDTQNYMGYAPDECYSEFSAQQMGRMHCWTGNVLASWQLPDGEGVLELNQTRYSCTSQMEVTLLDSDLAGDGTALVAVSSTSGDSETMVAAEVPGLPGKFTATVQLSALAGADNDGLLNVVASDTLTATYNDASNAVNAAAVVTVNASLDCTVPLISNVAVAYIGASAAQITFDTNETASSVVNFGTSCIAATESRSGAADSQHAVTLTGLDANTAYRFKVEVEDSAGNIATEDASGACYAFTTLDSEDFLTEAFVDTPDLALRSVTFIPAATPSGYQVCTDTISALPTSIASATLLSLDDDDTVEVTLSGGKVFPYFGTDYTSLWVNSNGSVGMGSGDTTATASFAAYFSSPRVAAMFIDLDPSDGGTVHRQQFSDRFVVTFTNVPEWFQTDATTMQTELFFDGTIRLSYLSMDADFGIAGLSRGINVAPVFSSSDFSAYLDCASLNPFVAPYITGDSWAEELTSHTLTILSEGLAPPLHYSWRRSGVPVGSDSSTLTIPIVTQSNEGTYRATVTDSSKQVYQTPPFVLYVAPANQLPVAGLAGLATLSALFGALLSRRRKP